MVFYENIISEFNNTFADKNIHPEYETFCILLSFDVAISNFTGYDPYLLDSIYSNISPYYCSQVIINRSNT